MPNNMRPPVASILLVEDHLDTARAMHRLLSSVGYHVRAAGTLKEAMDLARIQPFDLLISDIGLPDGSGLELMRQVNGLRPTKGIAVTGYSDALDVQQSRAAGFAAHIIKPTDLPRLLSVIEQLVPANCQ